MPKYEIRPLQLHILKNLLAMDELCKKHNLRYYIVAGTMLGAVRHGGFIPWDDDIDVGMPRKDYDLLMQHYQDWIPEPYEIIAYETDENYPFPFAKLQDASTTLVERAHMNYTGGVYIDIFPLDGITSNPLKQKLHLMRYKYLKKVQYFLYRDPYKHGRGISCWLPLLCRKMYTLDEVQRKMKKMQKSVDFDSSELVIDHDFGKRGIMPKAVFGNPKKLLFEGHEVNGVENPDEYLKRLYGDYMTIPPGPKQKQHNFYFLDLENSYKTNRK